MQWFVANGSTVKNMTKPSLIPEASVTARPEDLTAKARIRNAALTLFAAADDSGASMRAIASAAGVTVGLVVHHYGTKDQLRESVEARIVELFAEAIAKAPIGGDSHNIRVDRDAAVASMLAAHPSVVNYLRRTLLDVNRDNGRLLERLAELAANSIRQLQDAGLASTRRDLARQVTEILMTQLGQLFLQPLADRTFEHFDDSARPRLTLEIDV